ncbi:MAG: hypothetical protein JXR94_02025, partial [Candidatus Hydrogenedentes bacterium]|nr:hypothetical protein [Candidatus Hydrogenedentota bacterium]
MKYPERISLPFDPAGGNRLDRFLAAAWLPWALMALGAAFRLGRYLQNPAIWLDEAMLAVNILERPLAGLLGPLEYQQ